MGEEKLGNDKLNNESFGSERFGQTTKFFSLGKAKSSDDEKMIHELFTISK